MKAYILINIQMGMTQEIIRNLKNLAGVQSAEMTFGEYDVIVVVQVDDLTRLAKMVSNEIQPIPGVFHTVTCMAVDIAA
jgi:DNA-binding Lrp family transcriptional regulator